MYNIYLLLTFFGIDKFSQILLSLLLLLKHEKNTTINQKIKLLKKRKKLNHPRDKLDIICQIIYVFIYIYIYI